MVIDVQGAISVKKMMPEAVLIFIKPPSMEELRKRLKERKTENEAELERRMKNAEAEMKLAKLYDFVVINDDVNRATDELVGIIQSIRSKS